MGQDIKKLFEEKPDLETKKTPFGHKSRFEQRLDQEFSHKRNSYSGLKIAASVAILIALGFTAVYYFNSSSFGTEIVKVTEDKNKINSLADISPDLKKVEDYYLTHINYQFSKIKITNDNRTFLETYFVELGALQEAYKISIAKIDSEEEISEEIIDGLIENLQSRLKLMFQLKAQLKKIDNLNKQENENIKA